MNCIFCKSDTTSSKSIEHIIPESLGNKSHTLPKGVVCDKCNNYFASKIEKMVLELPYFLSLRGRNEIETKKGKIPGIPGFISGKSTNELQIRFATDNIIEVNIENKSLFEKVQKGEVKELYIPVITDPPENNIHVSKLLGKIAIEALAQRVINIEGWQNDFIHNSGLNELRDYVRFGKGYTVWPYHQRKIYNENMLFTSEDKEGYEILHEYDFLFPEKPLINEDLHSVNNLYFVCAIMGIEYTINVTNAGLDKYLEWLNNNQNKSILKMEKREFNNF